MIVIDGDRYRWLLLDPVLSLSPFQITIQVKHKHKSKPKSILDLIDILINNKESDTSSKDG